MVPSASEIPTTVSPVRSERGPVVSGARMERVMRKSTRRPLVATAAALAFLGVASAGAYAYWTTAGSGNGSAATGTSQAVTVTQLNANTTPVAMAPGDTAQYINFRINNPMATKQKVGTVTVSITGVKYGASWGGAAGVTADGRNGDVAHACAAG